MRRRRGEGGGTYCDEQEDGGGDVRGVEDVIESSLEGAQGEQEEHVHADEADEAPPDVRQLEHDRPYASGSECVHWSSC